MGKLPPIAKDPFPPMIVGHIKPPDYRVLQIEEAIRNTQQEIDKFIHIKNKKNWIVKVKKKRA